MLKLKSWHRSSPKLRVEKMMMTQTRRPKPEKKAKRSRYGAKEKSQARRKNTPKTKLVTATSHGNQLAL